MAIWKGSAAKRDASSALKIESSLWMADMRNEEWSCNNAGLIQNTRLEIWRWTGLQELEAGNAPAQPAVIWDHLGLSTSQGRGWWLRSPAMHVNSEGPL